MPGAVRQHATRWKTLVLSDQPKEKSSAVPPKTQYEPEARCSSPTTEALDLDFNAYSALYPGKSYSSGNPEGNANLQIRITPTSC
ncbi:MAG: hypothetical protein LQ337_003231 [Flavoplaca oasis]|nr:MAG: hypothetical protein LQ337_003231 [Flavoplaca oasis]